MASVESLEYLRSLIRNVEQPLERERAGFSLLPSGVPRGALVEITGFGKTEAVVQFLAEHGKKRVAWVEDRLSVYPSAVLQRKVGLQRILFVEAGRDLVWASMQILRSGLFECVVVSFSSILPEKVLRRLQLEVEKAHAFFFLLAEKSSQTWSVAVRLRAEKKEFLQLQVLKQKA